MVMLSAEQHVGVVEELAVRVYALERGIIRNGDPTHESLER